MVASACFDAPRSPRVLTEDPVVMGISLAVIEDGPYATDLASLPADRPRAEVLPLDTVELDALVATVDGPLPLDDAAWVLCGDGCLPTMEEQGRRDGALPPCTEDAAARSYACLAGRGVRPRVVMPAVFPPGPWSPGVNAFVRMAVIAGSPGGPTTDECLQQLVVGPRTELWGCAVGVKELPYGPQWALEPLSEALGLGTYAEEWTLPPIVTQLLPPNAAPRVEEVRIGAPDELISGQPDVHLEPRSIHEVLEVEAGAEVLVEPIVPPWDRQLVLRLVGPRQWVGDYESHYFSVWTDAQGTGPGAHGNFAVEHITLYPPEDEGLVHVYVAVHDGREAVSWFTLTLRVVAR